MTIEPSKAQDVWKDIGEHVQFTVLKLKRTNQTEVQEAIQEFADRSQAIIRSLRIRDSKSAGSELKVSFGFSNSAWDFLFPD
ncbi:MAG: Dyp-type peroxidase domain-containing protein, partial [Leuconostoc gelidum]